MRVQRHLRERDTKARSLLNTLLNRASAQATRHLSGLPAHVQEEALQQVLDRVGDALMQMQGETAFFVTRFNLWLKRQSVDIVRQYQRQQRDARLTLSWEAIGEELCPQGSLEDTVVNRLDIARALNQLSDTQRDAVRLHYVSGYPVTSRQKGVPSVCSILNISARSAHYRIKAGLALLRDQLEGVAQ